MPRIQIARAKISFAQKIKIRKTKKMKFAEVVVLAVFGFWLSLNNQPPGLHRDTTAMQLGQPEKITQAGYQSKHQTTERRPASPSASRSLAKTIARTIANIARPKEIGKSSRQDSTGNYAREAV
jgi:hypothetical protein